MHKRVLNLQTEELVKKYGMRYAYQWFVRSQDKLHLYLAQEYTDKKCKRIATLAGTNAAITLLLLIVIILKRSKCR